MIPYLEKMYTNASRVAFEKEIRIEPWDKDVALEKFKACDQDDTGNVDQVEFEQFLYDFLLELTFASSGH